MYSGYALRGQVSKLVIMVKLWKRSNMCLCVVCFLVKYLNLSFMVHSVILEEVGVTEIMKHTAQMFVCCGNTE